MQNSTIMKIFFNICVTLGSKSINILTSLGDFTLFIYSGFKLIFFTPKLYTKVMQQLYFIGLKSLFLIVLISIFCGMILGLQGYYTLSKFGAVGMLGTAVALTLIRELGPVLTAIMLAGRAGSSMAAEIGVMRITEQIDSLDVMDINPIGYLYTPRLIASLISFPLLTAIFDTIGIIGGYITGVMLLGINEGTYFFRIEQSVALVDVLGGFLKASIFSILVCSVCCYQGFNTHKRLDSTGPEAVGNATTSAVVLSCICILISNYILTSFLL